MSEMRSRPDFARSAPAIVIRRGANAGGVFRLVFGDFPQIVLKKSWMGTARLGGRGDREEMGNRVRRMRMSGQPGFHGRAPRRGIVKPGWDGLGKVAKRARGLTVTLTKRSQERRNGEKNRARAIPAKKQRFCTTSATGPVNLGCR